MRATLILLILLSAPLLVAAPAAADIHVGVPVCNVKTHICVCEQVDVPVPIEGRYGCPPF